MKKIQKLTMFCFLVGLIIACKPSGEKAETSAAGETAKMEESAGETYKVNTASSKVLWEGTKVAGSHNGTVDVSGGNVMMANGKLKGGNFTIDMNTINCLDLEGGKKANLEGHLKGMGDDNADDFFNVKKYPTATFEITKATTLMNDENANYIISGNLKMRDVTKQISFKAKVMSEGDMVTVKTPPFTIDRTDWGINYKSASFIDGIKDKAINDNMGLTINLTAGK